MKAIHSLALLSAFTLTFSACSSGKNETQKTALVAANAVSISAEERLVNAVQNFEKIEADERLALVTKLLEEGASPDALNELGEPVLADAVHFGDGAHDDIRVVRALIEKGAEVNKVGSTGRSPLTKAAESNKIEAIELMLAHGLVVNNENGTRAMVKAAFFGHRQVVQLLVANGLKPHGKYEKALLEMSREENSAAAALFGAWADIAREELTALLGANNRTTNDRFLDLQLGKITQTCARISESTAINHNMSDYFNRAEECTSMGRLGSLLYMHCYGMLKGNSANLQGLQESINGAAASARSVLDLQNMKFEELTSAVELKAHNKAIRRSMAMYHDLVLPWSRVAAGKMAHHAKRNMELRTQATKCQNKELLEGATDLGTSVNNIKSNQTQQAHSFLLELEAMEKMRAQIAYQLPLLGANEELLRREEEKKKQNATKEDGQN